MARIITQRELRNESGKIMRAVDEGESFVVTRNGARRAIRRSAHAGKIGCSAPR